MISFCSKRLSLCRLNIAILAVAISMLPVCHAYSAAKFRASSDPVKFARMVVRTHQVTPAYAMCFRSVSANGNASTQPCLEARASFVEFAEAFNIIPIPPDDLESFKATITAVEMESRRVMECRSRI